MNSILVWNFGLQSFLKGVGCDVVATSSTNIRFPPSKDNWNKHVGKARCGDFWVSQG